MAATNEERDKELPNGNLAMKTPAIVSQEWERGSSSREGRPSPARDARPRRRRMPWVAVEKKYEFTA